MIEILLTNTEKTRLLQLLGAVKNQDEIIENIVHRLERANDTTWYAAIKDTEPMGYDT